MKTKQTHPTKTRRSRARSGAVMMSAFVATTAFGSQAATAAPLAFAGQPREATATGVLQPRSVYESVIADILRTMRRATDASSGQARAAQTFDIQPGPLADAIVAFEGLTKISIETAAEVVGTIHSGGATGRLTPEQALQRLLAGTGLVHRFTAPNVVRIGAPGQNERVDVVGWATPALESPKFTAPLVDLPQSIAIIPNTVFNQQGAQTLTEVLRNTPGITFEAGENGFVSGTSSFGIRGFDTSGSVFVDGARDSGSYFRDVFNVEQVEVAKGPASDNGRGGAGGYVNMATKTPQANNFSDGTAGYNFGEQPRVTLDVNRQLGAGTAVRLNALWQDGGVPGRDVTESTSWGIAPSIAFGLDGPTRLVASYQRVEREDVPDWGAPGALFEDTFWHQASADGVGNRSRFYGHASDYDNVTSDSAVVRIEHDLSPRVRISNQTRWSLTEREALYTVPTGFVAATSLVTTQRQGYSRENSGLSNLTNLTATFETGSLQHSLATGVEFSREDSSANRFPSNGVLGNPGSVPVGSPDPNRTLAGFVGLVPSQRADVAIDTVAAYAYDTVEIAPQWQVTGGLRVERYDVGLDSRTAAGAPQGPSGYERTDTTVSGKVGLVFKPSDAGSVYGAVGLAALPPASYLSGTDISREGDNAFPGWNAGPNSATAKVQRSTNFEVGTKWNVYDERLGVAAALFRTERSNLAMAGTVDGVANTFAGYGQQIVQGLELSATGNLTPSWSLFGGVLFMDSERRHGAEVDAARYAANPDDYYQQTFPQTNQNPAFTRPGTPVTSTNGDELAFTPKVTANLWTTYRLPAGFTLGGGVQHVGSSYIGRPDHAERVISNSRYGNIPGYTLLNVMAIYQVNSRLNLRFNADNVTNAFYPVASNWNGQRMTIGRARAFVLSTDLRF